MSNGYPESINQTEGGYRKDPSGEIGSYEGSAADLGSNNTYARVDASFQPAEVPTPENSKRKSDVSQLPDSQDSAPNVGNLSC